MRRIVLFTAAIFIALAAIAVFWRSIPYGEASLRRGAGALVAILENRFGAPQIEDWSSVSGIVVLGGQPSRIHEALRLGEDHAHLRIVISGPSDHEMGLIAAASPEIGARIVIERKPLHLRKNTYGNAIFSMELVRPVSLGPCSTISTVWNGWSIQRATNGSGSLPTGCSAGPILCYLPTEQVNTGCTRRPCALRGKAISATTFNRHRWQTYRGAP